MLHEIKIKMSYADAILEGRKNFEVRVNDRGYNTGDEVEYTVVENSGTFSTDAKIHDLNGKRYERSTWYLESGRSRRRATHDRGTQSGRDSHI